MRTIHIFAALLLGFSLSACVPVLFVERDIEVERLQSGIFFLNVTAETGAAVERLEQKWHQQARRLCGGTYRHEAQLFHRQHSPRRFLNSEYKQMRGNIYCQQSSPS
ncbi:MAG: hypothetical protein HUJ29_06850 [Gammaproteobacteria bacterium]|nr:hypothetical protein [Gammaproteobacteria bacterium]